MSALATLDRPLAFGRRLAPVISNVAALVTRLAIGWAFIEAGRPKLANPEGIAGFFGSLGIPFPEANAAFVSRLEYYGGMLLIAGLLTRVVAALLSSTMIVALATAHREEIAQFFAMTEGAPGVLEIDPLPYLIPLLWLVGFGPGLLALDRLVFRWWSRAHRRPA